MSIKKIVYTGYEPTKWVDGVTPINAENLNHVEQGIYDCSAQTIHNAVDINQLTEAVFEIDNTCPEGVHKTVSKVDKVINTTIELEKSVNEHETTLIALQSQVRNNTKDLNDLQKIGGSEVTPYEVDLIRTEVARQGRIITTHEDRLDEKADKVEVSQAEARINESLASYATRTFVESEVRSFVETSCTSESGAIKREIMAEDVKSIATANNFATEEAERVKKEVTTQCATVANKVNYVEKLVVQLENNLDSKADLSVVYTKDQADTTHRSMINLTDELTSLINALTIKVNALQSEVDSLYQQGGVDKPEVTYIQPTVGMFYFTNSVLSGIPIHADYKLSKNELVYSINCIIETGSNPVTVEFSANTEKVGDTYTFNSVQEVVEATYTFNPAKLFTSDSTIAVVVKDDYGFIARKEIKLTAYVDEPTEEVIDPVYPSIHVFEEQFTLEKDDVYITPDMKYQVTDSEGNIVETGYFTNTDDGDDRILVPAGENVTKVYIYETNGTGGSWIEPNSGVNYIKSYPAESTIIDGYVYSVFYPQGLSNIQLRVVVEEVR